MSVISGLSLIKDIQMSDHFLGCSRKEFCSFRVRTRVTSVIFQNSDLMFSLYLECYCEDKIT